MKFDSVFGKRGSGSSGLINQKQNRFKEECLTIPSIIKNKTVCRSKMGVSVLVWTVISWLNRVEGLNIRVILRKSCRKCWIRSGMILRNENSINQSLLSQDGFLQDWKHRCRCRWSSRWGFHYWQSWRIRLEEVLPLLFIKDVVL